MKNIILIATVLLLTIACNKNQKAVKLLAGDWEAVKLVTTNANGDVINILANDIFNVDYHFDNCELEDDNYCNMSTSKTITLFGITGAPTVTNELFTIKNDGTIMEVKTDSTTNTINILELTETTLKATQTNANNEKIDLELKKK